MKMTPNQCIEKWQGKVLEVLVGSKGCCLVLKEPVVGSGVNKRHPLAKPIIHMPDQREILVALVEKAGGTLEI